MLANTHYCYSWLRVFDSRAGLLIKEAMSPAILTDTHIVLLETTN